MHGCLDHGVRRSKLCLLPWVPLLMHKLSHTMLPLFSSEPMLMRVPLNHVQRQVLPCSPVANKADGAAESKRLGHRADVEQLHRCAS